MKIAGYDDLRTIGRGGFGVVYQGRDHRFAREVAVKVLNGALDETMAARFERECHAVGALSGHPHIVVVHDSGTSEDGLAYLVMELLAGGSLADRLASAGPQPWPAAAELGVQLGGALETAHRGGVLHRDVKPENVLFSAYRQPKLVDFGIATVSGGFETKSASISASLAHAAPEILAGKRSSVASDVYALGSTLFQVLAGNPAFVNADDETMFPLLGRIAAEPVPDLRPRGVPDAVAAVIERAMAKRPADRYATALAFSLALQEAALAHGQVVSHPVVMGEEPAPAAASATQATVHRATVTPGLLDRMPVQPDPAAPTRPRRALALVAATTVLLGAAGGYVLLQGGDVAQASTYQFAGASDSSVRSSRSWSLAADGKTLSSDTALTNPSARVATRTALEVIPKSVATHVSQVTFTPAEVVVVKADPVVRWQVRLAPGQVAHLRWTVRLGTVATVSDLSSMAIEQRAAEQALVPELPAIAAAAHVAVSVLVPFPGVSVPDPGVTAGPPASPSTTAPGVITPPVTRTSAPTVPGAPVTNTVTNSATTSPTVSLPPALKVPGLPRAVLSGYVRVVTRQGGDPAAQPSSVSVGISWAAPASGGAPSGYCVRWTGFSGSSPYSSPSAPTCVTGRTARITVPHVNPANSWLRWEVKAVNKAGSSGWSKALAVVPDLVGGTETDGVDMLRAAGLRVGFIPVKPTDASQCYRITAQSPRSGTRTGGAQVDIHFYDDGDGTLCT